jgi:hypothetical protein
MITMTVFAGAFLDIILREAWDKAKSKLLEKSATKIFEDTAREVRDERMLENIDIKDFLKLCDRKQHPDSRRIIENVYQTLCLTEEEKIVLFKDFETIFLGEERDLELVFEEFLKIFLQEVVENSKDIHWKYWVWKQLKSKHKVLLESFEEALNFDVEEAKWFRGSPFWMDFKKNKIYKRKEIDTVEKKLEKENIQIVYGDAASGKSVIVKYIGYEYCKKPKPVYLIDLKIDNVERYEGEIVDLLDRDGLLIIEDAHLALHDVNWVVTKASGRRLKVLISTRPFEREGIREYTRLEVLMGREKNFTEIRAFDGAREIAGFYFSQEYGIQKLKELERVVEHMGKTYGKDLWLLSFALDAFSPEIGVDTDKIYENIYNKYLKKTGVGKNEFVLDTYKYLYPLSVFCQYEIPVCKDFLLKILGLNETYLNRLIEIGEVVQQEKMLFLHHSSRALYFLKAMLHYKLCREEEEIELIRQYIYFFCESVLDLVINISRYPYNRFDHVKKLTQDSVIIKKLETEIDVADNISLVGWCFSAIKRANRNIVEELVKKIDAVVLARKINGTNDLVAIGDLLSGIAEANEDAARKLLPNVVAKIDETNDLYDIQTFFLRVSEANENVARKLLPNVAGKIDKASIFAGWFGYYSSLKNANENVARELIEKIDLKALAKKLDENSNLTKIGEYFSEVAVANESIAEKLAEKINTEILAEKMSKADHLTAISSCLAGILKANENTMREVVRIMGLAKLIRKIDETKDLLEIGRFLWEITRIDKDIAREFAERIDLKVLAKKIDECSYPSNVGFCFSRIAEVSNNIAEEIINSIDLKKLAREIDWYIKEGKITEQFLLIGRIDGDAAAEDFYKKVDFETLRKKTFESNDFEEILKTELEKDIVNAIPKLLSRTKIGRISVTVRERKDTVKIEKVLHRKIF